MKNPIKEKAIAYLIEDGYTKDTVFDYENIEGAVDTLRRAELVSFGVDYRTNDVVSWFSILYFYGEIERTVIFDHLDDMYYDDLDEFVEAMLEIEDKIDKWKNGL